MPHGSHTLPEDLGLDEWSAVLRLNLTGYFLMAQAVGRQMIDKKIAGRIVNTSSTCGSTAMGRGNFVYSISKAGVLHFTRELALEWAISGSGSTPSSLRRLTPRPCAPGWKTSRSTGRPLASSS